MLAAVADDAEALRKMMLAETQERVKNMVVIGS